MSDEKCPICDGVLADPPVSCARYNERWLIRCPRCGEFEMEGWLREQMQMGLVWLEKNDRAKLSAWIRTERQPDFVIEDVKGILQELRNRDYRAEDKQQLLLQHLRARTENSGDRVTIDLETDFPIIWAAGPNELVFHLKEQIRCGSIEMHEYTQSHWIVSMTTSGLASLDDRPPADIGYHVL